MLLNCFVDTDWACDRDDRKLVAAHAVFLCKNLVSWSSKKQHAISRSSTESEYRALASAASEVSWIQALLSELQLKLTNIPLMWSNNQGAIALANNLVYHAKTKHVQLDIHFINEKVSAKQLDICYVPSADQTTDASLMFFLEHLA